MTSELLRKRDFLDTRDARQRHLERAFAAAEQRRFPTVISLALNLPGSEKHRPGSARLAQTALSHLRRGSDFEVFHAHSDLLGPFALGFSTMAPLVAKQAALAIEAGSPGARLLDIDIYQLDGTQVARRALGLPPRTCYLCGQPAQACIRLGAHRAQEVAQTVDTLLLPYLPAHPSLEPERLKVQLARGALLELDLSPKPGLVDRLDSGSHADLSYPAMRTSIDLLPQYYDELMHCALRQSPLETLVQVGLAAEARMVRAIHSNAHKGYIFLSGLVFLAAHESDGTRGSLRRAIADLASRFFAHFEATDTHGANLRSTLAAGGIREEALAGLPSVFEVGWPRYTEALEAGWSPQNAAFYLMAILMQRVEDTTTLQRGGLEGLARVRQDGARLQRLLEQQRDPLGLLTELNQSYCRLGLTMGGVADCMALTFALQECSCPLLSQGDPSTF